MQTLTNFWAGAKPEQLGVAKVVERYTKGVSVLPVQKSADLKFDFGKEVSLGGVAARVINKPFGDAKGSVIKPDSEAMVILGRKVATDHLLADNHPDARPNEQARATRAVARRADDLFFNGDGTEAYEHFNGLKARCAGDQVISAGDNGGALTLELFDAVIDQVVDQGNGRHSFMNKNVYRQLKKCILAEAGGAALVDVAGEVKQYEDVQLHIIGDKLTNKPILDFDEKQGNSEVTCSLYVLAPGNEDVELSGVKLLQASNGIQVLPEGMRDAQYIDLVEFAFGIGVFDDTAVARLKGITKMVAQGGN
jgi:hypothetical protein